MYSKKLFLLLPFITLTLQSMNRQRAPLNHVQSVVDMARHTASASPYTTPQQHVQAARDTQAVYGPQQTTYTPRPTYAPERVVYTPAPRPVVYVQQPRPVFHHTTYLPHTSPSHVTFDSPSHYTLPSAGTVLIAAGVTVAVCVLVYLATRSDTVAATPDIVYVPTPVVASAPGAPTLSAWDIAYNRLSTRDRYTIDALHLEQRDDYRARLQGTAQEQQELNNLFHSAKSRVDIIHTAQTQFLQYYYAYEHDLNNAALAQHVVRASDRLIILYNYCNPL